MGSETQETVRSLWEKAGKWSLEKQGEAPVWTCMDVGFRATKARVWLGC